MKLKNVLIVVNDIEKSKAFYKALFGLDVVLDNDGNVILTEGLVLQDAKIWKSFIEKDIVPQNNATELYFEEKNIEAFAEKLEAWDEPIQYVNRLMEHSWGQKVIRFYDPDGNLIEVGTPMKYVIPEKKGSEKNAGIIIKPMESEAEIKGKAYVHWKAWQEAYPTLVDPEYLNSITLEKREKAAFRWLDNILVAKDGDRVVGFVGYGAYRDASLPNTGEIYSLYILREYYGQKIGYALMRAAVEELERYGQIVVWVLKGNQRAITFYERFGFKFDGTEQKITLGTENTELRMCLTRNGI